MMSYISEKGRMLYYYNIFKIFRISCAHVLFFFSSFNLWMLKNAAKKKICSNNKIIFSNYLEGKNMSNNKLILFNNLNVML